MKSNITVYRNLRFIAGEIYLTAKLRYCFTLSFRRGFSGGFENMIGFDRPNQEIWASL